MSDRTASLEQRRRVLIVGSGGGGDDLQPRYWRSRRGCGRVGTTLLPSGSTEVQNAMQRLGVMTTVADPDLDLAAQYAAVAQCEAHGSPVEQAERLRDRLSRCWAPRRSR